MDLKNQAKDRFRGTLFGAAIGDALAFPHESESLDYIAALGRDAVRRFEPHRSGFHGAGESSIGAQLAMATAMAIAEEGDIDADGLARHLSDLWQDELIVGRDGVSRAAMERYRGGMPARDCGAPEGVSSPAFAVRAAIVGLWCHDDWSRLPSAAEESTEITHRDPRIIALAGVIASTVAYAMTHRELILGEIVDVASRVAAEFSGAVADFIEELPRLLTLEESAARRAIDAREIESVEAHVSSSLPCLAPVVHGLYSFLRAPSDPQRAMASAFFSPRDRATAVALSGAFAGAFGGVRSLDAGLCSGLASEIDISRCAEALYEAHAGRRV